MLRRIVRRPLESLLIPAAWQSHGQRSVKLPL